MRNQLTFYKTKSGLGGSPGKGVYFADWHWKKSELGVQIIVSGINSDANLLLGSQFNENAPMFSVWVKHRRKYDTGQEFHNVNLSQVEQIINSLR